MPKVAAFLLVAVLSGSSATAAVVGKSVANGMAGIDARAIRPVAQDMLDNARVGSVRAWRSAASGGNVRLISGGTRAGETCGRLRTTVLDNGRESSGYVFRYCRDAKGVWRTAG